MPEPPNIPGRPIVGGPNCPTNKLSNLMDLMIKPPFFQSNKLCKGLFTFLEMLPNVDFESTFVTFDVSSLYTNISHYLRLEAISYWIDKRPEDLVESRSCNCPRNINFLISGDNKHLLVFLAPNIIFIGQLEKDIGRRASGVQYLSPADQ